MDRKRAVLIIGLAVIILINVVVMPLFGNTSSAPDLRLYYSIQDVSQLLSGITSQSRNMKIFGTLLVDTPYAVFYGFYFSYLLESVLRVKHWIIFSPFAITFFDILENITLSMIYWKFPEISSEMVYIASLFTTLKWSGIAVVLIVFLYFFTYRRRKFSV